MGIILKQINMAHSNRQKLRDARGGKTQHQDNKSKRKRYQSSFDASARIAELRRWEEQRNDKPEEKGAPRQRRKYSMLLSAQERRLRVFNSLAAIQRWEAAEGKPLNPRVTEELKTLNARIIDVI